MRDQPVGTEGRNVAGSHVADNARRHAYDERRTRKVAAIPVTARMSAVTNGCYKSGTCPATFQDPAMNQSDHELHAAKRELEALIARMRGSDHARAFLGYADALVFAALRDLPAEGADLRPGAAPMPARVAMR